MNLEDTTGIQAEDANRSRLIQPDRPTILSPSVRRRRSLPVSEDGALDVVPVRAYDQIVVKAKGKVVLWDVLISTKGRDPA